MAILFTIFALDITAVGLLPVFQFDVQACPPGRVNYWGYQEWNGRFRDDCRDF